jgi:hypothetical protein
MHVLVNGVRLFFDVEGAKLVPNGPVMQEKPTLLLLHGGPGFDHSIYKPTYSDLAGITQIIYHCGNGRSEDGPREGWNLAQWGDDVRAFCDVLGIANPIVLGASFGGWLMPPAILPIPRNWCSSAPKLPAAHIRIGAWRCLNALEGRRRERWRAAGSWRFRVKRIGRHSTHGDNSQCRSIRARRAIRTWRAARSAVDDLPSRTSVPRPRIRSSALI